VTEGSWDEGTAAADHSATLATAGSGNSAKPASTNNEEQRIAIGVVDDVVGKVKQRREESLTMTSPHHHQQQQQQAQDGCMPSQQSSQPRSDVITFTAAWYKPSQRGNARRRWSEFIPPDTPPCSPASPDWSKARFTQQEMFTSRDVQRRLLAGHGRADSHHTQATTDAIDDYNVDSQVHCSIFQHDTDRSATFNH